LVYVAIFGSDLLGYNADVIANASTPGATLKKEHIALSFHLVQESVLAGIISPHQISSKNNIAVLLTKSSATTNMCHLLIVC
jgi:hypothetical protein